MTALVLAQDIERSADPLGASAAVERITEADPRAGERLLADPGLRRAVVAVTAASPWLTRICATDPLALDVLADLSAPVLVPLELPGATRPGTQTTAGGALARWKRLEVLRIAARDLLGFDSLEAVGANLSDLAAAIIAAATEAAGPRDSSLAVIGMGKLGARELNYASDIDLVLVGDADPRPALALVRNAWRVDLDLRPEGRSGPIVRSLASYEAYWDRWADTWEFQALLKARPVAGDATLGQAWATAASTRVWKRPFGADELREVRAMKAKAEMVVARRGMTDRELKLGRGGIRDIEFAVQLLQMVHGRADPSLRVPASLDALRALAAGGYVGPKDAAALAEAYRYLRAVEHRLQLQQDQQVHAMPSRGAAVTHLARVLGYRDSAGSTARAKLDQVLRRHQATVRSIHERLFFRPLLEAFTSGQNSDGSPASEEQAGTLSPEAAIERLSAFGFSDAVRTRQALQELTRGLTRSSRLMQQLLPLLLGWLSEGPDPDLGLLGLRSMTTGAHRRDQLTGLFRESAEAARQLCLLLATSPAFARDLPRHPDLLTELADGSMLEPRSRDTLERQARRSLVWRQESELDQGLLHFLRGEQLRIAARDILGLADTTATAAALTDLAETVLTVALSEVGEPLVATAFTVVAMGRLGGAELAYASDLDVMFVCETGQTAEADRMAAELSRLINGDTPAARLYHLDTSLRPEGRQGPVVRSVDAYEAYYARWAQPWERQALLRARVVAGDQDLAKRFEAVATDFVWGRPFGDDDVRELRRMKARVERERLPAGEDPQFHLKLGRGSLSDIEWTAQLLQLCHGVRETGTVAAIDALEAAGALSAEDAGTLREAYRFCEATRNRLYLVRGAPGDALPAAGPQLTILARSLGTTASGLRDEYRRRTRRARRVVERLFYGRGGD